MQIYDLTFDVETGMPSCGTSWHQTVAVSPLGTIDTVGRNTQKIILGSHSGTHMDAPYHFMKNGTTMESLDIDLMWGNIKVVDFRTKGRGDIVSLEDVKQIEVAERLLFAFGWYHHWKTEKYYDGFPYFAVDAVEYLIGQGMKVMALDTPSPDDANAIAITDKEDSPNHKILLENKVLLIEYLNNTDILIGGKEYEMVSLPLKVKGSDGSPARVLIRER